MKLCCIGIGLPGGEEQKTLRAVRSENVDAWQATACTLI